MFGLGRGSLEGSRHNEKAYRPSILRRIWPHVVLGTRRRGTPPPFLPSPLLSSRLPSPRRSSHVRKLSGGPLRVTPPIPGEACRRGSEVEDRPEGMMIERIVIEAETPGDSRIMFRVRMNDLVIGGKT
jgi:hypothetical protein